MEQMERMSRALASDPEGAIEIIAAQIRRMVSTNPGLVDQFASANPEFAKFLQENRGKTPEQAFSDNGIDFSQYRHLI